MDRYFSETPLSESTATIEGSEAHHLLHVMRAKPGHRLILFDGRGGEYEAEITRCGRRDVELGLLEHRQIERELPFSLVLAVALPKGDRQRWLIEKAVELGVTRLIPLITERTITKVQSGDKLQRYVIEASKQCGRNQLMLVAPPAKYPEFISQQGSGRRWFAHPGGVSWNQLSVAEQSETWVAIGPEGGFTGEEAEQASAAGWETVDLGSRILRIETAALALATVIGLAEGEVSHRT